MRSNSITFFSAFFTCLSLCLTLSFAQPPDTLWTSVFNGTNDEIGRCVQQTSDGGYIIVGSTESTGAGSFDVWLIKTDEDGNEEWNQTFGGSSYDYGYYVQQTVDGGYIIIGDTYSYATGGNDIWLIKTDEDGVEEWNQTFGNDNYEWGYCVHQTSDSGYILTGCTYDIIADSSDFLLIKTDEDGTEEWTSYFGGDSHDAGMYVIEDDEGYYVATGYTSTYTTGEWNVWLIKVDESGDSLWSKSYGGDSYDEGMCVQQTSDGGYVIGGGTMSFGGWDEDVWLIKTDENGDSLWSKIYGGNTEDYAYIVRQTEDNGFFLAGYTDSYGGGNRDIWLVRTNEVGDLLWTKTIGGTGFEACYGAQLVQDGGYIITGYQTDEVMTDYELWLLRVEYPQKITLEPQSTPVVIPASGGSFMYNVEVANNMQTAETFDIWVNVVVPWGSQFTTLGPVEITMSSGGSIDRWRTQDVPPNAPGGEYQVKGFVGDYPWTIVHSDSFTFTKEGAGGEWLGPEGWICTGELFPGDVEAEELQPTEFALHGAYPNPFNSTTTIRFSLPTAGIVNLTIYDTSGRQVSTAVDGWRKMGMHDLTWDANEFSSGIYFYHLKMEEVSMVRKMVFLK